MGTISRVTTWSTGDTLTAADLNGEFDNILSTANGSLNADNLGVTAGIASALKAVVLDANKDFADGTGSNQIRNLTISGSLAIGTTFLPDASGGADLGSATLEWGDLYIADDKFIKLGSDQNINIGYDETTTDSLKIAATEGAALAITLMADEGDDAGDEWKLNVADGGTITLGNDIASAGTYVTHLTLTPHATVASSTLALAGGLTVAGATQANGTVTVGADDQGYDVKLFGDTASAYLLWDTSADKLLTAGGATIDIVKDKLLIGGVAVTTTAAELNFLDTASAGTVVASKAVVVDSNKDIGSFRNVTLTGELDAATGDFSGDVDVDGTLEADAITLGGTALGSLYSPIAGSSSITTVGTIGTGTWQGTAVALAYGGTGLVGATDGKIVIADGSGAPVLLDVGSSTAITVLGTVATGTWQGTAVASAYLDADTAHLSTTQTFSGAKTFSAAAQFSNTVTVGVDDTGYDVQFFGATSGSSLLWDESADDLILTNAGLAVGSDATGDVYYRDANGFLARLAIGTDGQVLTSTGTLPNWEAAGGGSGGDFSGPGSSTDNAVLKFDGTGGKTGQNSGIIIDDSNNVTGAGNVTLSGELDAATGDFSGDVDVDGTLEADAITIGGTGIGSIYGVVAGSSSIVTTGALNSGSITSGFGAIDNGSSAITTTGAIEGGTLGLGMTAGYPLDTLGDQNGGWAARIGNSGNSTPYGLWIRFTAAAPDNEAQKFIDCVDNAATRFTVWSSGDVATSDGASLDSDERLKTNIVDATNKLADVMKLKVRNFEWTTEYHPSKGGEKKLGFIAQEIEEVFPALVSERDIAPDNSIDEVLYDSFDEIPDGKAVGDVKVAAKAHEPTMRKGYKDAFSPILVKAVQEVTTRLEAAEAKIATLESA